MQSKSPVRSRTWSSHRRRLMEGFNGHQDSSQHRSPVMYREDRMRDVNAVQEHGHPRSLSSRGSPPDQAVTRTNRRVEILDHQERADD
ncbi:hypothetical protein KY289_019810 [Solanum tuberosum]|nr:hypothetical protein KY289_019810 [Solanum tuberosum]